MRRHWSAAEKRLSFNTLWMLVALCGFASRSLETVDDTGPHILVLNSDMLQK